MSHHRSLRRDPREPQPGETIALLGLDGDPSGMVSQVQAVLSSDHRIGLHEVLDDLGQFRIVGRDHPGSWIEYPST